MTKTRALKFGEKLVIASHNEGKVREIGDLLEPFDVKCVSAGSLGLPEPEETGDTFEANALLKARASADASGTVALADDSGLCVTSLDGEPGIYSARWAGPDREFLVAMKEINRLLEEKQASDRSAHFTCVLALAWPDGHTEVFEGKVHGQLCWPPRGDKGFGYDPIFIPNGYDETFGEFDQQAKHSISHRAEAFRKLVLAALPNGASPA